MAWGAHGEAVPHVRVLFETGVVGGLIDLERLTLGLCTRRISARKCKQVHPPGDALARRACSAQAGGEPAVRNRSVSRSKLFAVV